MEPLVLVVEDEPTVAEITCRMLVAQGYRCESANTGRQATALVDHGPLHVDLAFIDIILPDMLGTEVARCVRERQPETPIVFTSASPEYQAHPPEIERSTFLPKPYSQDELAAAVHRLFPTSRAGRRRSVAANW